MAINWGRFVEQGKCVIETAAQQLWQKKTNCTFSMSEIRLIQLTLLAILVTTYFLAVGSGESSQTPTKPCDDLCLGGGRGDLKSTKLLSVINM